MFDKKLFKKVVSDKGYSLSQVAKLIGIDAATLYRKMNGESDFYRSEIQKICRALEINDPMPIFFAQEIA